MQRFVQQVRGGMVTHNVVAASRVHFGGCFVTHFGMTGYDFTDMHDHTCRCPTDAGHFDLPAFSANKTGVIDLTTRFNIKAGLGQNDLNLIIQFGGVYGLSTNHESEDFKVRVASNICTIVGVIFHAVFAEFAFGLQVFENACKIFRIFAAEFAHGFAAAGGFGMFFFRSSEASFVHIETLFAGNVTRDFEGQAVGGVKIESFVTIKDSLVGSAQV